MTDLEFDDRYFPRVDLKKNSRYQYYKYQGKDFAYDFKDCLVLYIYKDEDGIWRELDSVGLRKENWKNKEIRDEYLAEYCFDIDEECAYEMDSIAKEFGLTEDELVLEPDDDTYEETDDMLIPNDEDDGEILVEMPPKKRVKIRK